MRKMKLDVEALDVESFETRSGGGALGTVNAHQGISGFTVHPCQSIDIGCISDPTRCNGCQQTTPACP